MLEEKKNGREHKLGALDIKLPKKLVTFWAWSSLNINT